VRSRFRITTIIGIHAGARLMGVKTCALQQTFPGTVTPPVDASQSGSPPLAHDGVHPEAEFPVMKTPSAVAAVLLVIAGLATQAMPPPQATELKGEVLETMNVESYSYLRLKTREGEIWAAVPATTAKKGSQVTIGNVMMMENFESKTLKRKFDKIVFGTLVDPNAKAGAAKTAPHGAAPATSAPVAKVAKATGPEGKTVAEVVSGRTALKGKPVLVHGQVVRFNAGIMGKNWIHLQDGSGSAKDSTHDILVTTMDQAAVGDIVNARGTVRTDVNLGQGYAYAVLIEEAAIRK
jgi:hypothetical protein